MPYKSEKQRRYMHAKHPDVAKKWDEKYGGKIDKAAKSRKPRKPLKRVRIVKSKAKKE